LAIIGTDLKKAIALLESDEIVAIPTETVYGLAANGLSETAVLKIYQAKERPRFNPLILHIANQSQLLPLVAEIPYLAQKLMERFWPGPLTMLLPKSGKVPDIVTAGSNLVAVRMPNHPLTLELLNSLSFPLAAPSANPSGYVSPTKASHVQDQLGEKIPYILDGGPCSVGLESTIVGFEPGNKVRLYRPGGIPVEEIEDLINNKVLLNFKMNAQPEAPGMLDSHYAPKVKLVMDSVPEFEFEKVGALRFSTYHPSIPIDRQVLLSKAGSLKEAAINLFACLRELEQLGVSKVYGEYVSDYGIGKAINDRLRRASY